MTTLMDNTIDELIRRVKSENAVAGFVFVPAYPPDNVPNPIDRYLVTAANTGLKSYCRFIGGRIAAWQRGAVYECTLRLRTYAPQQTSCTALLRATSLLADAVDRADQDRIVMDIALSDVFHDTTARTIYRDVNVRLCCALYEEATA